MAFEVPHKHDISLDGQEMRNQMIDNFEAIENALKDVDSLQDKVAKLQKALGLTDDDLNNL